MRNGERGDRSRPSLPSLADCESPSESDLDLAILKRGKDLLASQSDDAIAVSLRGLRSGLATPTALRLLLLFRLFVLTVVIGLELSQQFLAERDDALARRR